MVTRADGSVIGGSPRDSADEWRVLAVEPERGAGSRSDTGQLMECTPESLARMSSGCRCDDTQHRIDRYAARRLGSQEIELQA